ncbi:hypothetical protein PV326_012482 [Microctonus aethiopoides]|nr:hypothetical protein PV326_012482 [Microctonus aethiopoides]
MYAIILLSFAAWIMLTSFISDFPNKELPFEVWLPFNLSTSILYLSAYVNQILAFDFGTGISVGYDILVTSIMLITCQQLKLLGHRFGKLHSIIELRRNLLNNQLSDTTQINLERELIAKCINHHLAIFELSKIISF